ncbi:MAG TPA: pyridoxal-dependent decarboxylase [Rudaea sp.]|uniref:pyridoxal phosphate-dependent decarboxylase family protein n=1 Tax=Rudaea sp. TaxID=2136325 RepID=UPI002F952C73
MNALLQDVATRASAYLQGLAERHVAPDPAAVAALDALDGALPDAPCDPHEVVALLDRYGSPATMAIAGPRFFGFVMGGALPAALAANWLASAWDQNTGYYNITPATARLEQTALRWLLDLLDLPRSCGGAFVTGANVANFVGLAAARHAVLARAGWKVEADGLFGAPPITVVVGEEAHPTLIKSLGLLGLGRNRVLRVPVDGQGRLRVDALPEISSPAIVCAQAGNVNTGACDAVAAIRERIGDGVWLHVDGAFGLWARVAPSRAEFARGIEVADSWATDAHKWLNVPYDSGLAFVRDAHALSAAMAITAEYLPTASPWRNPSDFTPELSRRARGVDVWAALRSLGRSGVAEMIERNCRQARRFAEALTASGFDVLNEVVLNQVLVSFGDATRTQRVIAALQADGTCWCGGTVWQGRTAMRISVCSWATTDADVERSIDAMIRVAAATP